MSKYYDVMCFYFYWRTREKILPGRTFVFFLVDLSHTFGVLSEGEKEHSRHLLLFIISIERLNNAVLFDDDCYEKRAKNNRSSEQY